RSRSRRRASARRKSCRTCAACGPATRTAGGRRARGTGSDARRATDRDPGRGRDLQGSRRRARRSATLFPLVPRAQRVVSVPRPPGAVLQRVRAGSPGCGWLGAELAAALWPDPVSRVALDWAVGSGGDPDDIAAQVESLQRRSSMAKFVWPIPDKGLQRRLHRIAAPTLLVWGDDDRANPVIYAEEWQRRVNGAALGLLPGGDLVLHEALEAAARGGVEVARP